MSVAWKGYCREIERANLPQVYSITSEGTSVDIVKNFPDVFSGVGKLKDYQLKLHVNKDVKPVA